MTAEDPHWPRASDWLRRESGKHDHAFAVVGLPMNQSLAPGHCDLAPNAIRRALARYSLFDSETENDLSALRIFDHGDLEVARDFPQLVSAVRQISDEAAATVLLGGDNFITRAGVHALNIPLGRCGVLTFDAHHDLRDLESGLTNGNPIRALLADGVAGSHIVQIGIQPFANSPHYAAIARKTGITVVPADTVQARGIDIVVSEALAKLAAQVDAIYVDLDVDVLDRSFAPACSGARPGGLLPWMLRRAARICGRHPGVKVMDIVEVDPTKDIADITALAAASFLLAFASGVQQRSAS